MRIASIAARQAKAKVRASEGAAAKAVAKAAAKVVVKVVVKAVVKAAAKGAATVKNKSESVRYPRATEASTIAIVLAFSWGIPCRHLCFSPSGLSNLTRNPLLKHASKSCD